MEYKNALEKAWAAIDNPGEGRGLAIRFLADTYDIDPSSRAILSRSCNVPAKDYVSIILLHYLSKRKNLDGLKRPARDWVDFRELEGGEGYYPAFKKRTIDVLARKFGRDPRALKDAVEKIPHKNFNSGDIGIILEALDGVPVMISVCKADDEFGPSANILFDRTISAIFCTEDIVVLTEIITHSL